MNSGSVLCVLFAVSIILGVGFNKFLLQNLFSSPGSSIEKNSQQIDEKCKYSNQKDQCYGDAFFDLTKKTDSQLANSVLAYLQKIDPQNTNGCHFIAHKISQAEVVKNPEKWQEILQNASPERCTGGYLHGVLEAHMATDPNFVISEQSFKTVCDDVYKKHSTWYAWRGCIHNMGHLMLVEKNGDIQEAVTTCNKIIDIQTHYECLSGAFMERITGENLVAHGILSATPSWDLTLEKTTEKLCGQNSGLARQACWKVISYVYFATSNFNPKGLYEKCQRAPVTQMRDECFIYGAGNMVATTRFNPDDLVSVCHQFTVTDRLFDPCMNEVIGSLLTNTFENVDKTQVLCSKTYNSYKKTCFSKILGILILDRAPQNVIVNTCKAIPKERKPSVCPA